MPLTAHLEELRKRLIISLIAYFIAVMICYPFSGRLFDILKSPLSSSLLQHEGSTFALHSITEGFIVEIKVALIAGLFLASPVIFTQIWKFVSPGLYEHEKRLAIPIVVSATLLFFTGAFFGYFVIFPAVFNFLMSYITIDTAAVLSINDYLNLSARLLGGFGLIFQLPLVIFVLARLGIVNHHQLRKARRYVLVACFVLAAVITPPDVISQIGIGIPLVVLYESGILIAWAVGRKRRTDEEVFGPPKPDGASSDTHQQDDDTPSGIDHLGEKKPLDK